MRIWSKTFIIAVVLGVLLQVMAGLRIHAAGIYTESFADGAAGWTHQGSWSVQYTNQALLGAFASQSFPSPEQSAWLAGSNASAGVFVGNYHDAGIRLMGFSFLAESIVPSEFLLRWTGASGVYFRSLSPYVQSTGIWYRFLISLADKESGSWVGSSADLFDHTLGNVHSVAIQITRSGTGAQRYRLDDFFVDGLPAGSVAGSASSNMIIRWDYLRTNVVYILERSANLTQGWMNTGVSWPATSRAAWVAAPSTNAHSGYRLIFNESP